MIAPGDLVSKLRLPDSQRVRILNVLHFAGIRTIGELANTEPIGLLRLPKFGRVMLRSIEAALFTEGYSLAGSPRDRIHGWRGWGVIEKGFMETFSSEEAARGRFRLRQAGGWKCRLVEVDARATVREEST